MNVVIVESAAKAKTINKYLGRDYQVMASYGHVRDLPSKDGSVDPDVAPRERLTNAGAQTHLALTVERARDTVERLSAAMGRRRRSSSGLPSGARTASRARSLGSFCRSTATWSPSAVSRWVR